MRKRKSCLGCSQVKSLSDYPPDLRAPDGKQARCRKCITAWMKAYYRSNPRVRMLTYAKRRAKACGFEFSITIDDIVLPANGRCPVFGIELKSDGANQDPASYSLDRINNLKGYVRGNVVVISYLANRLKNDGTALQHERIAAWMREMDSKS